MRKVQARSGPRIFADFEWLAGRFAEADRRSGTAKLTFDDAYVADSLPRRIAICEDMIRVEQELRR